VEAVIRSDVIHAIQKGCVTGLFKERGGGGWIEKERWANKGTRKYNNYVWQRI
jgi:hypothetical protein